MMKRTFATMMTALALRIDYGISNSAYPLPFNVIQPDGSIVSLVLTGDEYDHEESDLDGFTVIRGLDDYLYYAAESEADGSLVATEFVVGHVNPETKGLKKGVKSKSKKNCDEQPCKGHKSNNGETRTLQEELPPPRIGTLRNLVIPILFKDHNKRELPSREDIDILMNHHGVHELAPTGSVWNVFNENSYGKLNLVSTVVDWVPSKFKEKDIADGSSGLSTKIKELLKEALKSLDKSGFDFSEFDNDGDNVVDAVTFLHSGYASEFGGEDAYGTDFKDRIWSHKWTLGSQYGTYDGISVDNYHISPALWGVSNSTIGRIGVIAHETGHFLGLPDLYDKDGGGHGIGNYGLMANSWGFDASQYHPPHMCAWSKIQMGWLEPVEVEYGVNTVSATAIQNPNHPQVIKISNRYNNGEYLLIENRQPLGLETDVPQGGLAIYHIDENAGYDTQGFPGQSGWPQNGRHYKVALLQADGQYDIEKGENRGDAGDVFHAGGVDSLLPSDNVRTGPFPNTDRYASGSVRTTTNQIISISASGPDMTFVFTNDDAPVTSSPSAPPSRSPSPSTSPSSEPSISPTESPSTSPSKSLTPSIDLSETPSDFPSISKEPSSVPSNYPTQEPSSTPSDEPSFSPSDTPTQKPTSSPSEEPSMSPTDQPSQRPSLFPSDTLNPSYPPSDEPTRSPATWPTSEPSSLPSRSPSRNPTNSPTPRPSYFPSAIPTREPSRNPTNPPTVEPSSAPSLGPSRNPTNSPTQRPTYFPSATPTREPSRNPTNPPTPEPSFAPSAGPSRNPTSSPTTRPTYFPSATPTRAPTFSRPPSLSPSSMPSTARNNKNNKNNKNKNTFVAPTRNPSNPPTSEPSFAPSRAPSRSPSSLPSFTPTFSRPPTSSPSSMPSATPNDKNNKNKNKNK